MTAPRKPAVKAAPKASATKLAADMLGSNLGEDAKVPDEFLPQAKQQAAELKRAENAVTERVWIQLEDNEEIAPGGQFIGLNGVGYMLQPGVPAHVPVGLLNVLNDAIKSVPVVDPITSRVVAWKDRLRLPYRLVTADRRSS